MLRINNYRLRILNYDYEYSRMIYIQIYRTITFYMFTSEICFRHERSQNDEGNLLASRVSYFVLQLFLKHDYSLYMTIKSRKIQCWFSFIKNNYLNHRAYGLTISLRNREKLRLYTNYESRKDAIDRTQKSEVLIKQVRINSFFQALICNRSRSNTSSEKIVVYRCSKTEVRDS